ncbi:MAG: hypothetical protein ACFFCZ_30125 [Promethearchaeota archaeon]
MTNLDISSEEIRELLFYMRKVKSFEEIYDLQMDAIIRLIWGLLIIGGGILDLFLVSLGASTTLFSWLLIFILALIIQQFSGRYVTISERSYKTRYSNRQFLILLVLILIIVFASSFLNQFVEVIDLSALIMPTIALGVIYISYDIDRWYYKWYSSILKRNLLIVVPLAALTSIIISLVGYFLYGSFFVVFHGLIFGLAIGGGMVGVAYYNKRAIQQYVNNLAEND